MKNPSNNPTRSIEQDLTRNFVDSYTIGNIKKASLIPMARKHLVDSRIILPQEFRQDAIEGLSDLLQEIASESTRGQINLHKLFEAVRATRGGEKHVREGTRSRVEMVIQCLSDMSDIRKSMAISTSGLARAASFMGGLSEHDNIEKIQLVEAGIDRAMDFLWDTSPKQISNRTTRKQLEDSSSIDIVLAPASLAQHIGKASMAEAIGQKTQETVQYVIATAIIEERVLKNGLEEAKEVIQEARIKNEMTYLQSVEYLMTLATIYSAKYGMTIEFFLIPFLKLLAREMEYEEDLKDDKAKKLKSKEKIKKWQKPLEEEAKTRAKEDENKTALGRILPIRRTRRLSARENASVRLITGETKVIAKTEERIKATKARIEALTIKEKANGKGIIRKRNKNDRR